MDVSSPDGLIGRTVEIQGTVNQFNTAAFEQRLHLDLNDSVFSAWAGKPAVLAMAVRPSPPFTIEAPADATMGAPLECEHVNPDNDDTIQHTTTGLAYYRPSINMPMFTDGQTHWSLSNNQVLMWRNPSVVPPQPTAAESTYLNTAFALAQQLDAYQRRIDAIQAQANAGRLDTVDVGDVGTLYDEISNARTTIVHAPPSDRLAVYDQALTRAFDEAVTSAELLLRARLTEIPEARSAFLGEAATHIAESNRLQGEANQAYSRALPVVVG
jgi:hypothetical protein